MNRPEFYYWSFFRDVYWSEFVMWFDRFLPMPRMPKSVVNQVIRVEPRDEPPLSCEDVAAMLQVSRRWVMLRWREYLRGNPTGLPGHGPDRNGPVRFYRSEIRESLRRSQPKRQAS